MLENNTKILFVCPMPPPVHGSSMVSQSIKESSVLNDEFEMDFVNLSTSRTMEEIDKRSWSLYARKAVSSSGLCQDALAVDYAQVRPVLSCHHLPWSGLSEGCSVCTAVQTF